MEWNLNRDDHLLRRRRILMIKCNFNDCCIFIVDIFFCVDLLSSVVWLISTSFIVSFTFWFVFFSFWFRFVVTVAVCLNAIHFDALANKTLLFHCTRPTLCCRANKPYRRRFFYSFFSFIIFYILYKHQKNAIIILLEWETTTKKNLSFFNFFYRSSSKSKNSTDDDLSFILFAPQHLSAEKATTIATSYKRWKQISRLIMSTTTELIGNIYEENKNKLKIKMKSGKNWWKFLVCNNSYTHASPLTVQTMIRKEFLRSRWWSESK